VRSIYIEPEDDEILDLILNALECRARAYQRQEHTLSKRYDKAISNIKQMDENEEITTLDLLK
jgi:hypothetical protein